MPAIPGQFEKVFPPAERADLLCSQVGQIELMDAAALEKPGGDQTDYVNVANANSEMIVKNVYAYQPPQAFHDEHKFNDIILALALAHEVPPALRITKSSICTIPVYWQPMSCGIA